MAVISLIAGSILGWLAAFAALGFFDAQMVNAATVFFGTTLGFASGLVLIGQIAGFNGGPD